MKASFLSLLQKNIPSQPKDLSNLKKLRYDFEESSSKASPFKAFEDTRTISFSQDASHSLHTQTPIKVGVLLSGGQAPGGHNVIIGLLRGLKALNPQNQLWGFLGGPDGLLENKGKKLGKEIESYLHTGGFDMLGSGRTKIESPSQLDQALKTCKDQKLDALIIIGGDDSNTNAFFLAEHFQKKGQATKVFGVPKTIDGDLKGGGIETSFGFDTACEVYAYLISNLCRDALSAKKSYHFVRLMGRHASHITLSCALKTQANLALISEEIQQKGYTLENIVEQITELILKRKEKGKDYGVILIPEGLIEFIPELKSMLMEINECLEEGPIQERLQKVLNKLSFSCKKTFSYLPLDFQKSLLLDRDPHGNVQVSKIEMERLVASLVTQELKAKGHSFSSHCHFYGYEGRCAFPSNFDASYSLCLGSISALLCHTPLNAYIAAPSGIQGPAETWGLKAVALASLMRQERRKGKEKWVIKKGVVDLKEEPFLSFEKKRGQWMFEDAYSYVASIQHF